LAVERPRRDVRMPRDLCAAINRMLVAHPYYPSHCHSERSGIIRLRMVPESRNLHFALSPCHAAPERRWTWGDGPSPVRPRHAAATNMSEHRLVAKWVTGSKNQARPQDSQVPPYLSIGLFCKPRRKQIPPKMSQPCPKREVLVWRGRPRLRAVHSGRANQGVHEP
jgi:hypothetical protein